MYRQITKEPCYKQPTVLRFASISISVFKNPSRSQVSPFYNRNDESSDASLILLQTLASISAPVLELVNMALVLQPLDDILKNNRSTT